MRVSTCSLFFVFSWIALHLSVACAESTFECSLPRKTGLIECGEFSAKIVRGKFDGLNAKGLRALQGSFRGPQFKGADLSYAILRGSTFDRVRFSSAKMDKADLRGVKSVESDFKGVSFVGASLRDASFHLDRFDGCDFSGADLSGVVLHAASLQGARFDRHTQLPFDRQDAIRLGMKYVEDHL